MATRPRLLFLCQTLPFPPDGGVNIRSFNILRLLARDFEIDALCFYRRSDRRSDEAVEAGVTGLTPYASVAAFPIPQEYSRPRFFWDHVRSVVTARPYTTYAYDSAPFHDVLNQRLGDQDYALAHVDSLDLLTYLGELGGLPVACTHHNIESQLLRRRATMEEAMYVSIYLRLQAELTAAAERQWAPRVGLNVVVSPADEVELKRLAPSARTLVIPNGVDIDYFQPGADGAGATGGGIVFVGGSNWFPNRDALWYFAKEILPRVRERHPGVRVQWVGHSSQEDKDRAAALGVDLTGYVDDVRPYVQRATCYVVPLRVGGGTRLKVLDAWAMGKAVVTTSQGCEGLAAEHGQNALIADTPEGFADAVIRVLENPALASSLGQSARAMVERTYAWEVLGDRLLSAYHVLSDR